MNIQLIEGEFSTNETLELVAKLMEVKIKFHESKIYSSQLEEDIKSRENKIKKIQKSLHDVKEFLNTKNNGVKIKATITIE